MDVWHKALKWLDYNRYTAAAYAVIIGGTLSVGGCIGFEPRVVGPASGELVTAEVLEREVMSIQADYRTQLAVLDAEFQKDTELIGLSQAEMADLVARRAEIMESIGAIGTAVVSGTVDPAVILGLLVTIGGTAFGVRGIGVKADNKRKDAIIANPPA